MQNKIEKLISEVKDIKIKNRPAKKVKKEYEEMNSRELEEEKLRI
jgi:predicted transcriptional regulator